MSEETYNILLDGIRTIISRRNTVMRDSVSPDLKLSVTLRFLAAGESFRSLAYTSRLPANTISGVVPETCKAIYEFLKDAGYVNVPSTPEEWTSVSTAFKQMWDYPNCLGALDGKHINFMAPREMGSYYYNYKGSHSIVLLALVDAVGKFLFIDVGCNGRISDGGVFRNSPLGKIVSNNSLNFPAAVPLGQNSEPIPFNIIADDAFPLLPNLMKPFKGRNLSIEEKVFNYRLSRARRAVENAFGVLANCFRVLLSKINLSVEKVELVTLSTVALHNFLLSRSGNAYYASALDDFGSESEAGNAPRRPSLPSLQSSGLNRPTLVGKCVRENLKNYFNNEGSVSWQWEAVKRCNF